MDDQPLSLPEPIADQKKVLESAVTRDAMLEEFGDQHFQQDEQGWRVDLKDEQGRVDMRKVRKFNEMDRERRKAATVAGEHAQARVKEVTIKGPDGRRMKVPEQHAERIERSLWEQRR